jgi:hypothetical protein
LVLQGFLHPKDVKILEEPYSKQAADILASKIVPLVREGKIDSRSRAADALLEYALNRFGSQDPINDLVRKVESYEIARDR